MTLHRAGDVLLVKLDRPGRRNAFSREMRDGLVDLRHRRAGEFADDVGDIRGVDIRRAIGRIGLVAVD